MGWVTVGFVLMPAISIVALAASVVYRDRKQKRQLYHTLKSDAQKLAQAALEAQGRQTDRAGNAGKSDTRRIDRKIDA